MVLTHTEYNVTWGMSPETPPRHR